MKEASGKHRRKDEASQSRGHFSSLQGSHHLGSQGDIVGSLKIEKDEVFRAFGFDRVVANGGLSERGVSSTKSGLGTVEPAIVQRGVGECGKEQGFEDSTKHGKDAEGPNDVASDRGFFGLGRQENDRIVPPHWDLAGLQAKDEQSREP